MKSHSISTFVLSGAIVCGLLTAIPAQEAHAVSLKKSQITKVTVSGKRKLCGLFGKKWKAVKRTGKGEYEKFKSTADHRLACKELLGASTVKSLSALPSVAGIAAAETDSQSGAISTVSGTPPNLVDIPNGDLQTLFWSDGVISRMVAGNPTQQDCSEFFGGVNDGESGGLSACFMTQNVGYSFQSILEGGTSLCYMKGISNPSLLEDDSVQVLQGSPPGGSIERIFSSSASESRITKVVVSGFPEDGPEQGSIQADGEMNIFIQVASQEQNARKGNQYEFNLFHCDPDSGVVTEFENIQVKTNGQYVSKSRRDQGQGSESSRVSAWLKKEGSDLVWDSSKDRKVTYISAGGDHDFGSQVTFTDADTLQVKSLNNDGDSTRRSYSVSRFSGAGIKELKFLEGGFKDEKEGSQGEGFSTCAEFRDSYYAASTSSAVCDTLSEVDVETDSFLDSADEVDLEIPNFNCQNVDPDLTISMDFTKASAAALGQACELDRINGMEFCRSEELQTAEQNFFDLCINQQP